MMSHIVKQKEARDGVHIITPATVFSVALTLPGSSSRSDKETYMKVVRESFESAAQGTFIVLILTFCCSMLLIILIFICSWFSGTEFEYIALLNKRGIKPIISITSEGAAAAAAIVDDKDYNLVLSPGQRVLLAVGAHRMAFRMSPTWPIA